MRAASSSSSSFMAPSVFRRIFSTSSLFVPVKRSDNYRKLNGFGARPASSIRAMCDGSSSSSFGSRLEESTRKTVDDNPILLGGEGLVQGDRVDPTVVELDEVDTVKLYQQGELEPLLAKANAKKA